MNDWFSAYHYYLAGRQGSKVSLFKKPASKNQAQIRSRCGGYHKDFCGPLAPLSEHTLMAWKAAYAARN